MPHLDDKVWDIGAEAAVLGSMMLEPSCIPSVLAVIRKSNMFYLPEHRILFDAIVDLHVHRTEIDAVMLRTKLNEQNLLERVGGVEYIGRILDSVPSAANALYYANIVQERSMYRDMVRVIDKIKQLPGEPGSVNEQIEELHRLALSLQPHKEDKAFTFRDGVSEAVVAMADTGRECLPTGLSRLDGIIHGIYPQSLVVIAGRPGMGKSCLGLDVALHIARGGHKIIIFSLEMGADALMQRAICATAKVNGDKWADGLLRQNEFDEAMEISLELAKRDIDIYETVEDADKMYAICSTIAKTKTPALIIVDHIQLMQTVPNVPKEYERLTIVTKALKRIAMHCNTCVMAVCQLNREVEKRTGHLPRLSDLRGSGSIEQDGDLIVLLHREDQFRKLENPNIELDKLDGLAQLIVAKNKRGRTGTATLLFREEYTHFENLAPEYLGEQ